MFLAILDFTSFEWLLNQAEQIVKTHRDVKFRYSSGTRAITFTEPSYAKRMMHTCLVLGVSINYVRKITRLDVGIARTVGNSSQFNKIVSAFANSEMRKSLAQDLELQIYVSRRINDGGAKIEVNFQSKKGITHPSEWDIQISSRYCVSFSRGVPARLSRCVNERNEEVLKSFVILCRGLR